MSRLRTLIVAAVAPLALAAPASALVRPQLLSPRNGKHVRTRSRPTFVVRDTAPKKNYNNLYLSVAFNRKHNRCGALKNTTDGAFAKMHRRRGSKFTYVYRADFFDYPKFWLNRPGTYYWQVYRIDSGGRCDEILSKTRTLRVVR